VGEGRTALFMVCQSQKVNLHAIKALVELGADVNQVASDGKSPLLMLIMGGSGDSNRIEAVKLLIK
jgi:ankyrin repeat protein